MSNLIMQRFQVERPSNLIPLVHQQKLYKFKNGYGASIVSHISSHEKGNELAVVWWDGDDYHLTYNTRVTHDVLRGLSAKQVNYQLKRIRKLRSKSK